MKRTANILKNHASSALLRNTKGFTMAELLTVVAILVILMALAIPSLVNIVTNMRQKELDSKAEIIYVAAQNEMSKLYASGMEYYFQPSDSTAAPDGNNVYWSNYANRAASATHGHPADAEDDGTLDDLIVYIKSSDLLTDDTAASLLFEDASIDESILYDPSNWVIEYNYKTGTVYAVYYTGTALFYGSPLNCADQYSSSATFDKYDQTLRSRDNRLADGAHVGYYGGSSAAGSSGYDTNPKVTVNNGETLSATLSCTRPYGVTEDLVFKLVLSDNEGNSYTRYYVQKDSSLVTGNTKNYDVSVGEMTQNGRTFSVNLSLDSLESAEARFAALYGDKSGHNSDGHGTDSNEELVSGTYLKIELFVTCPKNQLVSQTGSASAETNSLFADASNDYTDTGADGKKHNSTGVIACARHLQNLDSESHVTDTVVSAVQVSDIEMGTSSTWYDTYGEGSTAESATWSYYNGQTNGVPNFAPINNDNLTSYACKDSSGSTAETRRIANLATATADEAAGLFGTINLANNRSMTVSDLELTGAQVTAGGTGNGAGALVGWVSSTGEGASTPGTLAITNTQSYLLAKDYNGKSNEDVWVAGSYAGGLVGAVYDGTTVNITTSLAASVVGTSSTTSAGGLIGYAPAGTTINVSESYADNYLVGETVGGLVGKSAATTTLANTYAAGFLTPSTEGAGLVAGPTESMTRSYTVASRYGSTAQYYSTAESCTTVDTVLYSSPAESAADLDGTTGINKNMTSAEIAAALNGGDIAAADGKFQTDTADTQAYNLMGQSLSAYTYPRLKALTHYNDWEAEFQVGALVYFEKYEDGTYGFEGANVESTLKTGSKVVGDGYGVVYRTIDTLPASVSVKVTDPSTGEVVGTTTSNVYGSTPDATVSFDGYTYNVYSLDTNDVNNTNHVNYTSFYLQAEITETAQTGTVSTSPDAYFFNPHFAKTVVYLQDASTATVPPITKDTNIAVRTARQLYNLSLYYGNYDAPEGNALRGYSHVTEPATFLQEREISYAEYEWSAFTSFGNSVTQQRPVGENNIYIDGATTSGVTSNGGAFKATYDGQCYWITDISFVTGTSDYVGFIGANEGTITNVVLRTDYDPDSDTNYYVRRSGSINANEAVYMGVIAGANAGKITNTAAAGYYLAGASGTIMAFENSTLYAGGLVGQNSGTISSCSADTPQVNVSALYANLRIGGFVGENSSTGKISNSYALGRINVLEARGGSVHTAGFAAENSGSISSSYCATALVSSGETTIPYSFAPNGGSVSSTCYFLAGGTYTYINQMNLYEGTGNSAGKEKTYDELKADRKNGAADDDHSFDYSATQTASNYYPYRAVVKDAKGAFVHYGNWQDDVELGAVGVFYWEHEEEGSNNGYHFTFLGTTDGTEIKSGTNLCNSHNDDGIITEFGYGYYVQKGQEDYVTLSMTDIASGFDKNDVNTYNAAASADLADQMSSTETSSTRKFTFYAITTRTQEDADGSNDYLCMNAKSTSTANGSFTLNYAYEGQSEATTYTVCPFFANAMSVAGGGSITEEGGLTIDFSATPGYDPNQTTVEQYEAHPYEIRSAMQLQYINWNANSKTYKDDSTASAGRSWFPYECHSYTNALNKDFDQTHDLTWTLEPPEYDSTGAKVEGSTGSTFYPLGHSGRNFHGYYNGNSYQIKNLKIVADVDSKSGFLGLFGEVGGSSVLENIILTADEGEGYVRSYYWVGNGTNGEEPSIGVLAGLTWMDDADSGKITIQNCSASGYEVSYYGDYKWSLNRTINVGGLIGALCGGTVRNCSAANDIKVDYTNTDSTIHRQQLGGIAGLAMYNKDESAFINCYSGGTITADNTDSRYLYMCGGIVGNAASAENGASTKTAEATVKNCYTYCEVPESNVSSWQGYSCTGTFALGTCLSNSSITNSYYLERDGVTTKDPSNATQITYDQMASKTALSSGKYLIEALGGDKSKTDDVDELLAGWHNVTTTTPSGQSVSGKYSFPLKAELQGKDYPFPAIIEQKDITFSTTSDPLYAYVHYGDWPIAGPYWSESRTSVDIFQDMSDDGSAYKTLTLKPNGEDLSSVTVDSMSVSEEGIIDLKGVDYDTTTGELKLNMQILKTGTVTITAKVGDYTATCTLEVTADLNAVAYNSTGDKAISSIAVNEGQAAKKVTLKAQSSAEEGEDPKDYSTSESLTWSLDFDGKDTPEALISASQDASAKNVWSIAREDYGDVQVKATATYTYNGIEYTAITYLTVTQDNVVGLAAKGDSGYVYNQADIKQDGSSGDVVTGVDVTGSDVPTGSSSDVYLYALTKAKELGGDLTIDSVIVTSADSSAYTISGAKGADSTKTYYVDFSGDPVEGASGDIYSYIAGSVYKLTSDSSASEVDVTVNLTDSNGVKYVLTNSLVPKVSASATVTYGLGGAQGTQQSVTVPQGIKITLPYAADLGYTWKGRSSTQWTYNGAMYDAGSKVAIDADTMWFNAEWVQDLYTIKLDPNGGTLTTGGVTYTSDSPLTFDLVTYDSGFQIPWDTPTWSDGTRTFYNWICEETGETFANNMHVQPEGSWTYKAQWITPVTFNAGACGGETVTMTVGGATYSFTDAQSLDYLVDGELTLPVASVGEESVYCFTHWTDENGNEYSAGDTIVVTPGLTLTANWNDGYLLTLMSGDTSVFKEKIGRGTTKVAPSSEDFPNRNGYTFDGWYTDNDGTGTKVLEADGTVVSDTVEGYCANGKIDLAGDKVLYARWHNDTAKVVWVPANSLEVGKQYLITNAKSGKKAYVVYQTGEAPTTVGQDVQKLGLTTFNLYNTSDYVDGAGNAIDLENAIIDPVGDDCIWTSANEYNGITLTNVKFKQWLAENGNGQKDGKWALGSIYGYAALRSSLTTRIHFTYPDQQLRNDQARYVHFDTSYSWYLYGADGTDTPTYLYEQTPVYECTFDANTTVTLDINGGPSGETKTESVRYDEEYTLPNIENKFFDGWNTKADGTGTAYAAGDEIDPNEVTTVYAQWKTVVEKTVYVAVDALESGADYVIVSKSGSTNYALYASDETDDGTDVVAGKSVKTSTSDALYTDEKCKNVLTADYIDDPDAQLVWAVASSSTGWTAMNGDNYLRITNRLVKQGGSNELVVGSEPYSSVWTYANSLLYNVQYKQYISNNAGTFGLVSASASGAKFTFYKATTVYEKSE